MCCLLLDEAIELIGEEHAVFGMRFVFAILETVTRTSNAVKHGTGGDEFDKQGDVEERQNDENFDVKHL